jgi:hypothetical protein
MSHAEIKNELELLGFPEIDVVDVATLQSTEESQGAPAHVVALALAVFSYFSAPECEQLGFFLKRAGDAQLQVMSNSPFSVTSSNEPTEDSMRWHRDGESKALSLDIAQLGNVALVQPNGSLLYAKMQGDKLRLVAGRFSGDVRLFEEGHSPLIAWSAGLEDSWMLAQIAAVEAWDEWGHVLTIARFARLVDATPSFADRAAALASLLHGEPQPWLEGPRAWAKSLSKGQRERIEEVALGSIDRLHDDLMDLEDDDAPEDPAWRQRLLNTLGRRDDLQGVCLLMGQAGDNSVIVRALESVDLRGERFAFVMGNEPELVDVQLARAAAIEMTAPWWTRFAKGHDA